MAAPMELSNFTGNLSKIIDSERLKAYKLAEFVGIDTVSYWDFFAYHLVPNKPCIFLPALTKTWKSRQEWVTVDGSPNFDFLSDHFGEATVPVANCKQEQYNSHPKTEMLMSEYIKYWKKYKDSDYDEAMSCLYLKDWHFIKRFPDYEAYQTPVYFQSDWLNEYWDTLPRDDYRFVYMGPKGTWTPFHADVFRSYSWSANICGKKKWIFYPPGFEEYLKDRHGNLVYDIMSSDLDDLEKFPHAHKVQGQRLEVIQGQGQVIFVPSGWHHQVFNLEDTISINHNWLNGCNIDICWKHLYDNLINVKHEIQDCRDMEGWTEQCQLILKATAGMDYILFIEMLKVITKNRLKQYHQLIKHSCCCGVNSNLDDDDDDDGCDNGDDDNSCSGDKNDDDCYNDDEYKNNGHDVGREGGVHGDNDDDNSKNSGNDLDDDDDAKFNDDDNGDSENVRTGVETKSKLQAKTDKLKYCDKDLESDFKNCDLSSNNTEKCSSVKLKKFSVATICKNCGKIKFEYVCEENFSMEDWGAGDYILFDLLRIEEVLKIIVDDSDYKMIDKVYEQSAEHVIELINKDLDLCLC